MLWHYTIAPKLPAILRDGRLKPTAMMIAETEKPVLWFSNNQTWEPTAAKGDGRGGAHSFETHRDKLGLCRFGLVERPHRVKPFLQIARDANMDRETQQYLIRRGREMGGDWLDWYGSLRGVFLDKCVFQYMLPDNTNAWVDTDPEMFCKRWHADNDLRIASVAPRSHVDIVTPHQ